MTLIKRLRASWGPDRELGREVLLACGWRKTCVGHFYGPLYHWSGPNGEHFKDDDFAAHDPTASLDAAMTLVPEGWNRRLSERDTRHWWAELREGYETCYNRVEIGQHATPAIALTIAALLARGIGG